MGGQNGPAVRLGLLGDVGGPRERTVRGGPQPRAQTLGAVEYLDDVEGQAPMTLHG